MITQALIQDNTFYQTLKFKDKDRIFARSDSKPFIANYNNKLYFVYTNALTNGLPDESMDILALSREPIAKDASFFFDDFIENLVVISMEDTGLDEYIKLLLSFGTFTTYSYIERILRNKIREKIKKTFKLDCTTMDVETVINEDIYLTDGNDIVKLAHSKASSALQWPWDCDVYSKTKVTKMTTALSMLYELASEKWIVDRALSLPYELRKLEPKAVELLADVKRLSSFYNIKVDGYEDVISLIKENDYFKKYEVLAEKPHQLITVLREINRRELANALVSIVK